MLNISLILLQFIKTSTVRFTAWRPVYDVRKYFHPEAMYSHFLLAATLYQEKCIDTCTM